LLRSAHYQTLLIAAGGNSGRDAAGITIPSAYPEVVGVGALDNEGKLRPYAEWDPQLVKPDLFMVDDLAATSLAAALKPEFSRGSYGSSFSALHAVATATLVWSILPELPPRAVRALLIKASRPIAGQEPAVGLNTADAVSLARQWAVERRLKEGPAPLQTLSAMTGLDAQVLADTLRKMDNVIRLTSGRLERYQLR
jgi:subtilisin family serine protease